ncbi:MAG: YggT family protein [Synechococcales cyanobacterium]
MLTASTASWMANGLVHPLLAVYIVLFVIRIFLSWYPQMDTSKAPYVWVVTATEFLLAPTRRVIPLMGGVDMTPVLWVGIVSLLREMLVGQQGILTMASHLSSVS